MSHDRRDEIAAGLQRVRQRVAAACAAAGRSSSEVTVVVVTKLFPASDVRILADLGVRDVGENRHQEAMEKATECSDVDVRWHFIGGLQSNKAAAVARYASVVHSVDRAKLVSGLSRGAVESGREVDCLLQVSLDPPGTGGRSGCTSADLLPLAEQVNAAEGLRLRGVMGVAPLGGVAAPAFARLAEESDRLHRLHPEATWMSAGMSADLEDAVRSGATHLRIGSAVLGPRPGVK